MTAALPPAEPFDVVVDDGVRIHGEIRQGRAGAPVVLGIHGLTATRVGVLPVARALGDEVTFIAYDVRGRGLSDKPQDRSSYGLRRNGEDAAAVLRHFGADDVVVFGQSNGAWIGEQLAAHHPSLVRALVLGDGGYFHALAPGEDPRQRMRGIMGPEWLERLRTTFPSRAAVLDVYRKMPAFAQWWDDDVESLLDAGLVDVEGGVRSRCADVAADVDAHDYFTGTPHYVHADLALITCPVHLLRSERGFDISPETVTPMITDADVEEFQQALPQLTVENVPGTNHYSINFSAEGARVISEAIRKVLP